jgi:hypothetical protein
MKYFEDVSCLRFVSKANRLTFLGSVNKLDEGTNDYLVVRFEIFPEHQPTSSMFGRLDN